MNDLNDQMKGMLKAVPWQLKLLWGFGLGLSCSLLLGIFWLIVVLIKHFS